MKKVAAHRAGTTDRLIAVPPGYRVTTAGILAPHAASSRPIPPSKLRAGFRAMKRQLDESLDELLQVLTGPYHIASVELTVSFDVDGKFMGFGVGGATTMKLVIRPIESD